MHCVVFVIKATVVEHFRQTESFDVLRNMQIFVEKHSKNIEGEYEIYLVSANVNKVSLHFYQVFELKFQHTILTGIILFMCLGRHFSE